MMAHVGIRAILMGNVILTSVGILFFFLPWNEMVHLNFIEISGLLFGKC